MRYIPFHETARVDHWHILDTETREVAVWHISATSAQREADELNARPETRTSMSWTPLDGDWLDESIRTSAQRATLRASDEFWAEAELVATAAGYCEVYDRIAAFLGGPVRGDAPAGRRHYEITLTVNVSPDSGVDEYSLERATITGLDGVSGLRYTAYPRVKRVEDPATAELRAKVEELRAKRAEAAQVDPVAEYLEGVASAQAEREED